MKSSAGHELKNNPSKTGAARTAVDLARFMLAGISGVGAAKIGWEMLTGPKSTLSDIGVGMLLCCAPLVTAAVWGCCLFGIARHYHLI